MTWPQLTVLTDALDPLVKRTAWLLEERGERQLLLLDEIEQLDGFPPEIEFEVIPDPSEYDSLNRALQHGDMFVLTPRGGYEGVIRYVSMLHGRRGTFLAQGWDPSEGEDAARGIGRISVARHPPGLDLDLAAEALVAILTAPEDFFSYEVDLGALPEIPDQ